MVPLYKMNKQKGFPEFIGTSVYFVFGPMRLLITAEHVLTDIFPDKILFPYSEDSIAELPCDGIHKHKRPDLDIGMVELKEELQMWYPLDSIFMSRFNQDEAYQHLLIGYPASSTKKSNRNRQAIELKGYLTSAAADQEYKRLNISKEDKMVLEFKKKNVFAEKRKMMTFPKPYGMSGGAVFQFHEEEPEKLFLVGIMNAWDPNRKNAIIATKIEKYTEMFKIRKIDLTTASA